MLVSRTHLFTLACFLLLLALFSSFSSLSCSNSNIDEQVPTDGSIPIPPDTINRPDGRRRPDFPCSQSVPHRKRTGSWALGPDSLAPNSFNSWVETIATDSQGNVILLVVVDDAPVLMKIGPDSVPLWTYALPKSFHTAPPPALNRPNQSLGFEFIRLDSQDNVYIAGIASGKIEFGSSSILVPQEKRYYVLFKFSSQGQPLWLRSMQEYRFFTTFSLSPQGELYAAGYANDGNIPIPEVSQLSPKVVVAKYGNDGTLLWLRTIYGTITKDCTLSRMVVDSQENIYLTGSFYDKLQFGTQNPPTINAPPPSEDYGDNNLFVTKLDKHGSFQWASYVGTHKNNRFSPYNQHSDIIVDKGGNVYITGSWQSTRTFGSLNLPSTPPMFLAKLTPSGVFAWAIPGPLNKGVTFYPYYNSFAHKLHLAHDGSLIMTGNSTDNSHLVFSAHFDTSGKWLSIVRMGYADRLMNSAPPYLDKQGNLFVAGRFSYDTQVGDFIRLYPMVCSHFPEMHISAFLWRLQKP